MQSQVRRDFEIKIDEREVLRYQGYRKNISLKDSIRKILVSEIEEGYRLIQPQAISTWMDVLGIKMGALELPGGLMLNVGGFIEDFKNSTQIGIAICTVGRSLEERVAELFATGKSAEALMLDSVGSVVVESVADAVNYSICQTAGTLNLKVGARFSPGYGKWDIVDQKVLFQFCDSQSIGVSLNPQCMMTPRKSVSFCVGIGSQLTDRSIMNSCRYCNMRQCPYRREG